MTSNTVKRTPYVRWTFYLLCLCLLLLAGTTGGVVYLALKRSPASPAAGSASGISGEMRRDLAGKLLSAGLPGQSVEQYTLYLSESDLPPERQAPIAFTIGKLLMEAGRYEEALTWLYQVEMLDPKSPLAPEVGSKIVACLEHLGRFAEAEYTLDTRVNRDRQDDGEVSGDEVVATIGTDTITVHQLNEAINLLPDWMRSTFDDPARKEAFLQQYVAEELLYRKARKLELDKDEQVRRLAAQALRQILVQKVLEKELQEEVKVRPEEIELYFRANQDRYRDREAFKVRMIEVPTDRAAEVRDALQKGEAFSQVAARYSTHGATSGQGGMVDEWIEEGMDPTGMGDPGALWGALSPHGQGDLVGPVTSGDNAYLFRIVSRREPSAPALDAVQDQVRQDLYKERMEKAYQALIRQTLQVSDVKIYPEKFVKAESKKDDGPK